MNIQPRFLDDGMPVTPVSPGDLRVIAEMVRAFPYYVRLIYRASQQRERYLRFVEGLQKRLAQPYSENVPLPLTMQEIETIEAAMQAFEMIMTAFAPQTEEIDAMIRASMRLRQCIALMRSHSPLHFLN